MEKKVIQVKSKPVSSDTESWYKYINSMQQGTPSRLEDVAKYISTMISLCLTIVLAVKGGNGLSASSGFIWVKAAIAIWLLSLVSSFLVLFPWHYKYASDSVDSIKETHRKIVTRKYVLLVISVLLFLCGMMLLMAAW